MGNSSLLFLLINISLLLPVKGEGLDILYRQLHENEHPSDRFDALIAIGDYFEHTTPDSAEFYYLKANQYVESMRNAACGTVSLDRFLEMEYISLRNLGILKMDWGYYKEATAYYMAMLDNLKLREDTTAQARVWLSLGNIENFSANYSKALEYYQNSLDIAQITNSGDDKARALHNLGVVHQLLSNYPVAIEYIVDAMELYEQQNMPTGKAGCLIILGNMALDYNDFPKALRHYKEAYNYSLDENFATGIITSLMNVGLVHVELEQFDKAVEQFQQSMEIAIRENDKINISKNLHNIGLAYARDDRPYKALEYYLKARDVATECNFTAGIVGTTGNIASIYNDIKDYNQAITYGMQCLELAKQIQTLDDQRSAYGQLFRAYEGLGQMGKALEYHKLLKFYSDSILNIGSLKDINRIEALYYQESMKQQVDLQKARLEKQEVDFLQQTMILQRQRLLRNAFILGFIALSIFSLVIFRNLNHRKKANLLMLQQNQRMESVNDRLKQQNVAIKNHRDQITQQKQIIEEKNQTLVSSIRYARQLQQALLPKEDEMHELLGEHFMIFHPREMVSGDFCWVGRQNDYTFVAIADSTGHGVPGAFLSILGLTYLNDYIATKSFTTAGNLLDDMREYVIHTLKQEGGIHDQTEGFDMSLVAFNKKNSTIQYAGARCPLIIAGAEPKYLNKKPPKQKQGIVSIIPADSMPLAFHLKMKKFTTWEIKLQAGSMIYLMTDGFADQLGGKARHRFSSQRIIKLLEKVNPESAQDQKKILSKAFFAWKSNNQQVDDVSLLGIRI